METEPGTEDDSGLAERVRRFSSPLVRRMAADAGVDLSTIEGTGIHGRVTKKDILAYIEARESAPAATPAPPAAAQPAAEVVAVPTPAPVEVRREPLPRSRPVGSPSGFSVPAFHESERVEIEPMSRIRRLTADHMVYSQETSAHVTTVFEVDMSNVVAARARAKDEFLRRNETKLTYRLFLFQAVIEALKSQG